MVPWTVDPVYYPNPGMNEVFPVSKATFK